MRTRLLALALVLPALTTMALLFAYPLAYSIVTAFQSEAGWGVVNFVKAY